MQFSFKNKKFDVTFSQTFSGFYLQMYAVQILYPGMKLWLIIILSSLTCTFASPSTTMFNRQKYHPKYLHLNLSMIFPPQRVAKAILTAKTEILPCPSLFKSRK